MSDPAPTYTHSGHRYVLGYVGDSYAIWDRNFPGTPAQTYPRSDEGWQAAWSRFIQLEPAAAAVGGTAPTSAGSPSPGWATPPVGAYPVAYPPRTNGMAIAAMVLGIVWIYGIGSVLALVFGYTSKGQIEASGGREQGRGMAIAGIVLGWVGLGVLILAIIIGASIQDWD
jgi:hypothetical protein